MVAPRVTGADSQCALTTRMARGRGSRADQRTQLGRPHRIVEERRCAVAEVQRGHPRRVVGGRRGHPGRGGLIQRSHCVCNYLTTRGGGQASGHSRVPPEALVLAIVAAGRPDPPRSQNEHVPHPRLRGHRPRRGLHRQLPRRGQAQV